MLDRMKAAWLVLRGSHKAVPMGASVFYGNYIAGTANCITTPSPIYFNHTGGKPS